MLGGIPAEGILLNLLQPAVGLDPLVGLHGVLAHGGHVRDLLIAPAQRLPQLARPAGHGAVLGALDAGYVAFHAVNDAAHDETDVLGGVCVARALALDLARDVPQCAAEPVRVPRAREGAQHVDSGH